jgi:hypothetical protein
VLDNTQPKYYRDDCFGDCMDILKDLEVGQERSFTFSSPTLPSRKDYELLQKTVDAVFEEADNDRLRLWRPSRSPRRESNTPSSSEFAVFAEA